MQRSLSVYLDLLRFLAAAVVFLVHANYDRFTGGLPFFWRIADIGNDAVMVFFVLSGFVIAYVTGFREKTASDYFAARLARLWSVVVPAVVLTVALDTFGSRLSPIVYDGWWFQDDRPVFRVLANLFFVNELWFSSVRLFSNGPFWSIGYEFWYYVIFGTAVFCRGPLRVLCVATLLLLVGPKILLLIPVWLAGAWAYKTRLPEALHMPAATGLFFGSLLAYFVFRYIGAPQVLDQAVIKVAGTHFVIGSLNWSRYFLSSYCIGALIALNFVAARAMFGRLGNRNRPPLEKPIAYLAGFTFSLYLFHYPLLQFFAAVADYFQFGASKRPFVVGAALLSVWLFGSWAERQKIPLKHHLLNLAEMSGIKAMLRHRSGG